MCACVAHDNDKVRLKQADKFVEECIGRDYISHDYAGDDCMQDNDKERFKQADKFFDRAFELCADAGPNSNLLGNYAMFLEEV